MGSERSAIRNPQSTIPGPACPFCGAAETELFSLFSQFLLASQYYCRSCRTVFDRVRWDDKAPDEADPDVD